MVAKMLGILPNCFVSPSKVSRTSGAAFSFTSGLTMAMRHLLICEGITWSQESIPNAAQLGTDTGIPTSLTNSPRQRTRMVGKQEVMARSRWMASVNRISDFRQRLSNVKAGSYCGLSFSARQPQAPDQEF